MAYKSVCIQLATRNYYWFFTLLRLKPFSWCRTSPSLNAPFPTSYFLFSNTDSHQRALSACCPVIFSYPFSCVCTVHPTWSTHSLSVPQSKPAHPFKPCLCLVKFNPSSFSNCSPSWPALA